MRDNQYVTDSAKSVSGVQISRDVLLKSIEELTTCTSTLSERLEQGGVLCSANPQLKRPEGDPTVKRNGSGLADAVLESAQRIQEAKARLDDLLARLDV